MTNKTDADIRAEFDNDIFGTLKTESEYGSNNYYALLDSYQKGIEQGKRIEDEKLDCQIDQLIIERDHWSEKADELAYDIAKYFDIDIGEHSNVNCPVDNAIELVYTKSQERISK